MKTNFTYNKLNPRFHILKWEKISFDYKAYEHIEYGLTIIIIFSNLYNIMLDIRLYCTN